MTNQQNRATDRQTKLDKESAWWIKSPQALTALGTDPQIERTAEKTADRTGQDSRARAVRALFTEPSEGDGRRSLRLLSAVTQRLPMRRLRCRQLLVLRAVARARSPPRPSLPRPLPPARELPSSPGQLPKIDSPATVLTRERRS